jgi:chemotaxis protein methyltransferase CheR
MTKEEYQGFCVYFEKLSGIVLGDDKQYLVRSRLTPLLMPLGLDSLSALLQMVGPFMDSEIQNCVLDAMTTNETLWFRDTYPFIALTEKIFPFLELKKQPVRIWSAASSSGQEAYSIAMTATEYGYYRPNAWQRPVEIIGSDISTTMLAQAKLGIYDKLALTRGLSLEKKRQFFTPYDQNRMQICKNIREMVTFQSYNLKDNIEPLGAFDVIFCRNVLIYFSPEMKLKVLNRLIKSLKPKGFLILGGAESLLGLSHKFTMIRCHPGIIYQLK